MLEGMYSAAAGMAAQQQRLDALSNDIANVNTNGYKRVRTAFHDLLYTPSGAATAAGSVEGAGAAAVTIGRGAAQGAIQQTGEPLDVALQGPGYLQVRRADGTTGLTRDGALRLDDQRRLTTQSGELVDPAITLPAGTSAADVSIATDGTVRVGTTQVGKLRIVTVPAPDGLQPVGDNDFVATAASGAIAAAPATTTVQQGALEGSNVDLGDAMTEMVQAQRAYELASRAIQAQDKAAEIANGVKR
jgi:flagellar basal-body rod protein FlgG